MSIKSLNLKRPIPREEVEANRESKIAEDRLQSRILDSGTAGVSAALIEAVIVELMNRGYSREVAIGMVASYLPRRLADTIEEAFRNEAVKQLNREQWEKK